MVNSTKLNRSDSQGGCDWHQEGTHFRTKVIKLFFTGIVVRRGIPHKKKKRMEQRERQLQCLSWKFKQLYRLGKPKDLHLMNQTYVNILLHAKFCSTYLLRWSSCQQSLAGYDLFARESIFFTVLPWPLSFQMLGLFDIYYTDFHQAYSTTIYILKTAVGWSVITKFSEWEKHWLH